MIDLDESAQIAARRICEMGRHQHWGAFVVRTAEDAKRAATMAKYFHDCGKYFAAQADEAVQPLKKVLALVKSWWQPGIDISAKIKQHLKDEVSRFRDDEALRQQAALAEATTHAEVLASTDAMSPVPVELSARTDYVWEITDPEKIPREYLTPDRKLIARVVKKSKGKVEIPGVSVEVRTRMVMK